MKRFFGWCATALFAGVLVSVVWAAPPPAAPPTAKRPLFSGTGFRPRVALHDVAVTTDRPFVSITGIVFSRAGIDRVSVGDRTAAVRQAEPKDLMNVQRVPDGASDAPFRTYFEVRDLNLAKFGANDIEIRAVDNDGRTSDVHRITVVRLAGAPEPAAAPGANPNANANPNAAAPAAGAAPTAPAHARTK